MRKASLLLLAASAAMLASCGTGGSVFNRERPDEFAVQRQAPLVVPPDFELVPPTPGAPRPTAEGASEQALEALFGGPAPRSTVETSAISKAGEAAPGIRSIVGDVATHTVQKGTTTQAILAAPQGDGAAAQAVIPG